jgi:hypothetical protein
MPKHPGNRYGGNAALPPSLADLGIGKMDSSRWQQIAAIPPEVFERHVGGAVARRLAGEG